jgi:L-ascorbate metabolism protein UlaG (beta-lactamase superfamily)
MAESANHKILMDAVFGGFKGTWCDIPDDEIKTKMENAESPFNNTDLIFVSHRHSDHLNPAMLINHVINNPGCMVICPKQTDSVLALKPDYDRVKNNIISVTPPPGSDTTISVKGAEITVYRLEHSHYYEQDEKTGEKINIHRNTENVGFLIKADGVNIFHCGDSNPMDDAEYKYFNLADKQIDIAFLERLFLYHVTAKGIGIIENYIKPEQIILMHVEPGKAQKYKDVAEQVKDRIPEVYIFEKPMEEKTFSIRKFQ